MDNDYKFMTYKDAAAFLGISLESVRVKASRANWPKKKNNKNRVMIGVPVDIDHDNDRDNKFSNNHDNNSDNTNTVHELQMKVAVLEVELKAAVQKSDFLETQNKDLLQIVDKMANKRFLFWRRAG